MDSSFQCYCPQVNCPFHSGDLESDDSLSDMSDEYLGADMYESDLSDDEDDFSAMRFAFL